MFAHLLLHLVAPAFAEELPTLSLCEGARASDYATTIAAGHLRFMDPGSSAAGESAAMTCRVMGGEWQIRATGADGVTRAVRVAAPTDAAGREAVGRAAAALWTITAEVKPRPVLVADAPAPPAIPSAAPPQPITSAVPAPPTVSAPPPISTSVPAPPTVSAPPPPEFTSAAPPPPVSSVVPAPPTLSAPPPVTTAPPTVDVAPPPPTLSAPPPVATAPPALAVAPPPPELTSAAPPPLVNSAVPAPPTVSAPPPPVTTAPPDLAVPPSEVVLPDLAALPPPDLAVMPPDLAVTPPPEPPPPATASPPEGWLAVGPRLVWRSDTGLTNGVSMAGGGLLGRQWWLGAELGTFATRNVNGDLSADAGYEPGALTLRDFSGQLRGAWSPLGNESPHIAPVIGLALGAAAHTWFADGVIDRTSTAFLAGLDLGLAIPLVRDEPSVALLPVVRFSVDLGPSSAGATDGVPVVLAPWQADVGLCVRVRTGAH